MGGALFTPYLSTAHERDDTCTKVHFGRYSPQCLPRDSRTEKSCNADSDRDYSCLARDSEPRDFLEYTAQVPARQPLQHVEASAGHEELRSLHGHPHIGRPLSVDYNGYASGGQLAAYGVCGRRLCSDRANGPRREQATPGYATRVVAGYLQ